MSTCFSLVTPISQNDNPDMFLRLNISVSPASAKVVSKKAPSPSAKAKPEKVDDPSRKLGIALVGLGNYSKGQLAPALQETQYCRLAGLVSGSPQKVKEWQRKYAIPATNVYNYENFDEIKSNSDIDIVYVVLPNSMHRDFVIRAARAGKQVICEKPMEVSVEACEEMIRVCEEEGKLLSIGYRLHFEPYNLTVSQLVRNRSLGNPTKITAGHGMDIEPNVWRLNKKLAGGGPLMDVGIYCVQAAMYVTGMTPIAVTAQEGKKTDRKRFAEVEQSMTWQMEFANGVIAHCETSYAKDLDSLRIETTKSSMSLEPAYAYEGIKGKITRGKLELPKVNQQALQMDDFAVCVLRNEKSRVSGEMGLRDVKILLAIYEAARTGKRIELNV
jgi:predicted dehydrogenase